MLTRRTWLFPLLLVAMPLHAQEGGVANTLLTRARAAYDAMNYPLTDSLTRNTLSLPSITTKQRVLALQLRAAALYPEEDGLPRYRTDAIAALQEFVKLTFDQRIARDLSWPGLDSLLLQTRQGTFAARAFPEREYALQGPLAVIEIPVRSTRRAAFRLIYLTGDGGAVPLDSLGPDTTGVLRVRSMIDNQPALPIGAGDLQLTMTDVLSEESVVQRFTIRVKAPPIGLLPEPAALSPHDFKPERKKPARVKGIVLGLLVGGATIAVSTAARGPEDLKEEFDPDGRAVGMGIGLGLAVAAAGFLDPGPRIQENIRANSELRTRHGQDQEAIRIQNQRLLAAYRQTITFESEAP
jgi:hypothetical protein